MTAIVASDILFLLSAPGASSGYSTTGTPGNSLGKFVSTTQLSGTALDNLFLDLTGAQNAANQVDYQCVFVLNNTASGNSMLNTLVWMPSSLDIAGGATVAFALDTTGITSKTSGTAQALTIANSTTAPAGISTWYPSTATNSGGRSVGTVAPNQVFAVWIQRTAHNTAPVNNDGFTLEVDFDTQG